MDVILSHEPWNLLMRILLAAALGGILGIEHEIHGRQAGLRTHLLVSAGSALFFILSTHIATFDVIVPPGFTKVTDPGRIAAQIVTGIGFLGAGVILKEGFTIVGLQLRHAYGSRRPMASGAGLYIIATSTTVLALISLISLRWFERFYRKDIYRNLLVSFPNEVDAKQVIELVKSNEVMIISFGIERDYETLTTNARMQLRLFYKGNVDNLSHLIVEKLEQSHIPLKAIKWLRP